MLDNKANEILQSILDSIEQAYEEQDQEILIEAIKNIPEAFWKDTGCSMKIMEKFFDCIRSDFFVYPIDFIPEDFWKDEDNAWSYALVLSDFYGDDRIDYNMFELLPVELLRDKKIAKLFLGVNYIETIGDISGALLSDPEVIYDAFDGISFAIEQHNNMGSMVQPLDVKDYLQTLFDMIPRELASNKNFILDIFNRCFYYDYIDDNFEILVDWIDIRLRSDKEFIMQCLKNHPDKFGYIFEFASDELMADEEFKAFVKENFHR